MDTHPEIFHPAKDERIRAIAYAIWEEEGRPEGCAEDHWLRACGLIEAEADGPEVIEPMWLKRAWPDKETASEKLEPEVAVAPAAELSVSLSDIARRVAALRSA